MSQYTDPKVWGSHFWFVMRCVANNYNKSSKNSPTIREKREIRTFFTNLKYILPCEKCKIHYAELLKQYPLEKSLCCKSCLIKWVEIIYKNTIVV